MADSGIKQFVSGIQLNDWTTRCIEQVMMAGNQSVGFVDAGGHSMSRFVSGITWGIDRKTCLRICNSKIIPLDFQFQTFAAAFTNYLLPWLGLIAQLPTETNSNNDGFISLCLAVGSPAFITYSLMLTIRNRYWVRDEFNKLYSNFREVNDKYPNVTTRLNNIQYVLKEAQQVPLRLSQEEGWFSSLIVAGPNEEWWKKVNDKLRDTRRGRTLSLIFQMAIAIVAWLFTIIAAFAGDLGNISTALQISAGSVWIWMVPVIWGWIVVGTQQLSDSIDKALETDNAVLVKLSRGPPNSIDRNDTRSKNQRGLVVAHKGESGLIPYTSYAARSQMENSDHISPICNPRGDEKRRGPVFNYARVFTYSHLIQTVIQALKTTVENIRAGKTCSGDENGSKWKGKDYMSQLSGDAVQTEAYCGLGQSSHELYAYPEWSEIPSSTWISMGFSAVLAIFLQWGTTGAALMIAYLTPTMGLGCRSGGYLLYGINATISWLLLAASSLFSHSAMLRYQREKQKEVALPTGEPSHARRSMCALISDMVSVRGLAALTRYFGKALAVANAFLLVAISLFEFTGGFNNCWCYADTVGLGDAGWVVLFKTARDLEQAAKVPWAMGIALSIFVCLFSLWVFWSGLDGSTG